MAETIGVVGGGALGTLLMRHLVRAGLRVHGLVRNPGRRAVLARELPELHLAEGPDPLRPASLVFLCVKAYDTAPAVEGLRRLDHPRTALCSLQNGWGNLEVLERGLPGAHLLAATTTLGAYLDDDGALHESPRGATLVASWGGTPAARAVEAVRVLEACGLPAETRPDARAILWRKLVLNAAVNPLTALTGRPNGALVEDPGLWRVAERAALEAARVGSRLGLADAGWDPRPALRAVLDGTRTNRSSMAQDLARGRRTEIDAIAGAIVEAAAGVGEDVPVLAALLALVRCAETGPPAPARGAPPGAGPGADPGADPSPSP